MQTSSHCSTPQSLSLALLTWTFAARILPRRKGKVSYTTKWNRECRNRKTAEERDCRRLFLQTKRCCSSTSKVSWSRNQHIQLISVAFEPGEEVLFIDSKPVAVQGLHSGSPQNCFTIIWYSMIVCPPILSIHLSSSHSYHSLIIHISDEKCVNRVICH